MVARELLNLTAVLGTRSLEFFGGSDRGNVACYILCDPFGNEPTFNLMSDDTAHRASFADR